MIWIVKMSYGRGLGQGGKMSARCVVSTRLLFTQRTRLLTQTNTGKRYRRRRARTTRRERAHRWWRHQSVTNKGTFPTDSRPKDIFVSKKRSPRGVDGGPRTPHSSLIAPMHYRTLPTQNDTFARFTRIPSQEEQSTAMTWRPIELEYNYETVQIDFVF